MTLLQSLLVFVKERYPVTKISPIFVGEAFTGYIVGLLIFTNTSFNLLIPCLLSILLLLFFFQLRIFDDLKDYNIDVVAHPDRPLSRGEVSIKDLHTFSLINIFSQFIIVLIVSLLTTFLVLYFYLIAFVFSIFMRYEFFVKNWIKQHIFVYLFTHQLIVPLIMIVPYISGSQSLVLSELGVIYFVRVIVGNYVIELVRKTVGKEQERDGFETYSSPSILGSTNAAILILGLSIVEFIPIIYYWYFPNIYWNVLVIGSYLLFVLGTFTIFIHLLKRFQN
jgi:4-hydroxybenzoate polyprenyltransferase